MLITEQEVPQRATQMHEHCLTSLGVAALGGTNTCPAQPASPATLPGATEPLPLLPVLPLLPLLPALLRAVPSPTAPAGWPEAPGDMVVGVGREVSVAGASGPFPSRLPRP